MHTFIWEVLISKTAKVIKPPLKLWLHFSQWQIFWCEEVPFPSLQVGERETCCRTMCSRMPFVRCAHRWLVWDWVFLWPKMTTIAKEFMSFHTLFSRTYSNWKMNYSMYSTQQFESPYKHTHLNACFRSVYKIYLSHWLLYRPFKPCESTIWGPF